MTETSIHPTALIAEDAELGQGILVGPFTIIHSGVRIGAESRVGSHCEIGLPTPLADGKPLEIGARANIRSHSVIYQGSRIGPGLTTGHHITIREKSTIGTGFQLGSRGDVQGKCTIGDYVRIHSDVHIGQQSELGNFIWLFPNVLLANDPDPPSNRLIGVRIRDFAVVAANALLMPGVEIGVHAVVAAGSVVKMDVPAGMLVSGNPAQALCKASLLRMHNDPAKKAYPWNQRFHRGYPEEVVRAWLSRTPAVVASRLISK